METLKVGELKSKFSHILQRVQAGEEIIISFGKNFAASFYHLPRITHKDPFDRMLIWQAIREKMVLISKDSKIAAYKDYGLKILPFS